MTAIKSQHSRGFEQLVAVRRQQMLEAMAAGTSKKNYWRLVGEVQGLDDALKLSEQADFNISGEEPDAGA